MGLRPMLTSSLLGIAVLAAAPATAQDTIKVGTVFPLTGPTAVFGTQNFQGVVIAADMINDRGGVKGKKIEIIKGDASSPQAAIAEVNRLITQAGVKILVGSTTTAVAMPATQEAERAGVFYWEGAAIAEQITERGFKYTFRVALPAAGLGTPAMDYTVKVVAPTLKRDPKDIRVAIVGEESSFGISMADVNVVAAKEAGVQVVLRETYPAGSKNTDLSPLILKLRSANPDVLIATAFFNDAVLLGRQMKELRFVPKAYIGTSAGHSTVTLADALGDAVNGTFSSSYPPDVNPAGLTEQARADLIEFKRRYQEKYNVVPSVQEVVGFVAGWSLFRDVIGTAESAEPEKLREAVMKLDVPVGSYINGWGAKFDAKGQNARSFATVVQWQDKKMTVVYPLELATAKPIMLPAPGSK